MNIYEIDSIIKQAQSIKRNGDVKKARQILEECLKQARTSEPNAHAVKFAPIYKSLGKICHLDRDLRWATIYFIEAVHAYKLAGLDDEAAVTLVHLACCGPFGMTKYYEGYLRSLMGDDSMPPLPQEVVMGLLSMGEAVYAGAYPTESSELDDSSGENDDDVWDNNAEVEIDRQDDVEADDDDWDDDSDDDDWDDDSDDDDWGDDDEDTVAGAYSTGRVYKVASVSELDAIINLNAIPNPEVISPEMFRLLKQFANGSAAMQQGDLNTAANIYRQLLVTSPSFVAPRVNLGNCLVLLNKPAEGLQELKRASQYAPRDIDVHMAMARAYSYQHDSDNEMLMYKTILQIDPRNFLALNNLGATCRDMAQLADSESWLLRAQEEAESVWGNDEQKLMAYHNLAMTYANKNEVEKSIEYWERCVRLNPSDSSFRNSLKEMQERKRIKDTAQPIYLKDGSVSAPDGYELQLSGFGASIGPWSGPVPKEEYQGWIDVGYKFELIKVTKTSSNSSTKSTVPVAKSGTEGSRDNSRKDEPKQTAPVQIRIPIPDLESVVDAKKDSASTPIVDNLIRPAPAKTMGGLSNNVLIGITVILAVIGLLLVLSSVRLF